MKVCILEDGTLQIETETLTIETDEEEIEVIIPSDTGNNSTKFFRPPKR